MISYIQSLEVLWNKLIQNSILLHAVMSSQNNANVHQLLCKCTSSPHVAGRIDLVRSKTAQVFDTKVNSVSIQLTDNVAVWTLLGNGRSIFSPQKHLSHQVLKAFMHNNSIDFKVQWSKCLPVFEEFSLVKDFDTYMSYQNVVVSKTYYDLIIKSSSTQYFSS